MVLTRRKESNNFDSGSNMKRNIVYLGLAGLFCASVAIAEQVYVSTDTDLLPQKDAAYTPITTIPMGTGITVMDHEGNWMKVQFNADQGFVYAAATQADQPGPFTGVGSGHTVAAGAAGKGLGPDATEYASQKNFDPKPLNDLIAFRTSLGDPAMVKQLQAFRAQGGVGLNNP